MKFRLDSSRHTTSHIFLTSGPSRSVRRVLRTKEADEYLAVSEWKIRQLLHTGDVPYIQERTGYGHCGVNDLDGYIERNKRVS